jgi:hypothetical protein
VSDNGNTVNYELLQRLVVKPHKHLNIIEGAQYGLMIDGNFDHCFHGVGEVMEEARAVQHLCDMAGIPEGEGYSAHIDARVFLLMLRMNKALDRLGRIASWHSRETGSGGMVGDFCTDCGNRWPCDTHLMAMGTYVDEVACDE